MKLSQCFPYLLEALKMVKKYNFKRYKIAKNIDYNYQLANKIIAEKKKHLFL